MMYFNRGIETFVTSHITTCGLAKRELSKYSADKSETLKHSSELESLMKNEEDGDEEINLNGDVAINGSCRSTMESKGSTIMHV